MSGGWWRKLKVGRQLFRRTDSSGLMPTPPSYPCEPYNSEQHTSGIGSKICYWTARKRNIERRAGRIRYTVSNSRKFTQPPSIGAPFVFELAGQAHFNFPIAGPTSEMYIL